MEENQIVKQYIKDLLKTIVFISTLLSGAAQASISNSIANFCPDCIQQENSRTATVILDKGATALLSRAWLARNATKSIDVQYFIWSEDNIGILAAAELLKAAERGVKVRVLVDDFLIKADLTKLIALEKHPNINIKIYNPLHNVGVSSSKRIWNLVSQFRNANQRMHDKLAVFDGRFAITGGRNMADEYFDFNKEYSFRDRDVLVFGKSIQTMQQSFERFWQHDISQSLSDLMPSETDALKEEQRLFIYKEFNKYANNTANFSPDVKLAIESLDSKFPEVTAQKHWSDAEFISDLPGKNSGDQGVGGGGRTTTKLLELIQNAESEIIIQSPYVIVPDKGIELFRQKIEEGVQVKISTNSLLSTDNLMAFSGYHKVRQRLLDAGVELYEYKPNPKNFNVLYQRLYREEAAVKDTIFAIHAKSMVVDQKTALIGSFNMDPRSINLNTEVAMVIPNADTASLLRGLILGDMHADNSWKVSEKSNPDKSASFWKRLKLMLLKLLPLQPIL